MDFEILLHDCCTKQKQQDILMGIRFEDPAGREHMMAYDKQTIKRLYNDVQRGNNPL